MKLAAPSWILFSLLLCIISCTTDTTNSDALPELILTNISYGNHPQQTFDLYLPEGRSNSKTKVIVLVHGGGWINGDKVNMQQYVDYFRSNHPDHAVLNLNYVLAVPDHTPAFPNQYIDIQSAITYVSTLSDFFHILPEYGMLGSSAGAHLAMMYDYAYDTDNRVKFIANIVGPSDFTDPFYMQSPDFNEQVDLLVDETQYPEGANYVELNSPVYWTNQFSSPTLMFYGKQDQVVPISNGFSLRDALTAENQDNSMSVYDGGHGNDWTDAEIADMYSKIDTYVYSYLNID